MYREVKYDTNINKTTGAYQWLSEKAGIPTYFMEFYKYTFRVT